MLAATFAALLIRLFRLGHSSLWIDESLTWLSAGIGRPFGSAELLENLHGPLYTLLLHVLGGVAGDSEFVLRLPSAVFGALTVPAMAWLAARWLGRETAVPAAWLTAGSPFLVWYSQEARNYALLLLAAVTASALLLEMRARVTAGRLVGYGAALVTGALSNFSFGFLAPIHLRWWLGSGRRGVRLAALAGVALAVAVLPWVPQIARVWDWARLAPGREAPLAEAPLRGATTYHAAAVPFTLYTFAVGPTLGPALREMRTTSMGQAVRRSLPAIAASAVVFGALGALGFAALRRRGRLGDLLVWTLPAALLVSWFALSNFKVFHPRYLMVSVPPLLLAIAAAFADLRPRLRLALGIAVASLWAIALAQMWFVPRFGKEDYRSAFAYIRAHAGADDRLIAMGADHPLEYYNRGRLPMDQVWLGFAADSARFDRELDRARGGRAAWVVLSRGEDLDPERRAARRLGTRFPGAGTFQSEGVDVWRIPAPAGP